LKLGSRRRAIKIAYCPWAIRENPASSAANQIARFIKINACHIIIMLIVLVIDIDECEEGGCHANASCANSLGSFSCDCNAGFTGDGENCGGIDLRFSPMLTCRTILMFMLFLTVPTGPLLL
jgi:hypothetical protein